MRLYIAEKPSMGREIAKNLPGAQRKGSGFIQVGDNIVTWLFGHVLHQAEPQDYNAKYKTWRAEDLPIVPQQWQLLISPASAQQFHIVKDLITKAEEIVHAGDPDREGQLLVDEVLEFVGNTKPVRRILLNALDEKSVKEAIGHLRENQEFFNLKQSALSRARADWLIGMNLSRAYTLAAQRSGRRKIVLPVGRVKTPTLALVVRREQEIENFRPVDFYNIKAQFQHPHGSFVAQWKPKDTQAGLDPEGRLLDKAIAQAKLEEFLVAPTQGQISGYSKTKKQENQRLPFALSSLQVWAGKRFGYEPQKVLDAAQSLYEKKYTTYPRSDCEYLPTNQYKDAAHILNNLQNCQQSQLVQWAQGADHKIKSKAWNDSKISAHHAIIPTSVPVKLDSLSIVEQNIYFLIAQAYLAQFYPVHTFNQTKVEVTYKDELFTASGRVEIDLGWKALYTSKKKSEDSDEAEEENSGETTEGVLPAMKKKDAVEYLRGELTQSVTKPPVRFTQATLIAAMKDIHKYVQNPEAKKQLKAVYGIGTEATRATILDELINKRKLMKETGKKKYLQPTPEAYLLIGAMPPELAYPDFTAIWEDQLHSMAEGKGTMDKFLAAQVKFTQEMCAKALQVKLAVEGAQECPRCHQGVLVKRHGSKGDFWGCSAYPSCRMSCNDLAGKPNLAEANKRTGSNAQAQRNFAPQAGTNSNYNSPSPFGQTVVYDNSPYMSEEEMAAFQQEFAMNDVFAQASSGGNRRNNNRSYSNYGGFGNKEKVSAAPMEHLSQESGLDESEKKYLCPKCREGNLRRIKGANGMFWGCSNYPRCTATFDDEKGLPVLEVR